MRLDLALVARGLARSRNQAATLIAQGKVSVDGRQARKASLEVSDSAQILVSGELYVARSAGKLADALDRFNLEVPAVCLDAGASTGGFTQVLLERGAECVLAVDVGHNQLSPELIADPRVRNLEGHNIRDLTKADLAVPEGEIQLVVADLSFISLTLVAAKFAQVAPKAPVVALIKPQFELDRSRLNKAGVVQVRADRLEAVRSVIDGFAQSGYRICEFAPSSVVGASGNQEYLALFRPDRGDRMGSAAIAQLV